MKGENSIKVFGPDLEENEKNADADRRRHGRACRASKDLGMFTSLGQPSVKITPDRAGVRALRPQHAATSTRSSRRPSAARPSRRSTRARSASTSPCAGWRRTGARSRRSARSRSRRPTARTVPLGQIAEIAVEDGPVDHLPRGRPALRAGEVLASAGAISRAPSPRRRRKVDAKVHAAVRHAPRVGGEINELQRGRATASRSSSRSRSCSSRSSSTARSRTGSTRSSSSSNIPVACTGGVARAARHAA